MATIYPVDAKFGEIVRTRGITINLLSSKLDLQPQVVFNALTGVLPIGAIATFPQLDRIYGTTPGYFEAVYENCRKSVEEEHAKEKIPPATVTITVDLLKRLSNAALDYHYQNPAGREGWAILTALGVKDDE